MTNQLLSAVANQDVLTDYMTPVLMAVEEYFPEQPMVRDGTEAVLSAVATLLFKDVGAVWL